MASGRDFYTKNDVIADCLTCGWRALTRNAWGLGAQHARKHDHQVHVEVSRVFVYNSKS